MRAKGKYKFDSELLRFNLIKRTFWQRFYSFSKVLFIFFVVSVAFNILFTTFFETPKEKKLIRERESILLKYSLLNKQLNEVEEVLAEIQQRDDFIYRPIFEEPAIPYTVREAGFGGVNRYAHLKNLHESEFITATAERLDKIVRKIYIQSKSYDRIIDLATNKDKMINCLPAIQPVAIKDLAKIGSFFGTRIDPFTFRPKHHEGMDFNGRIGTDIYATGDGVVRKATYSMQGYGFHIDIDHGFGYLTRYAHLSRLLVREGQHVKRGEVIGLLGNTGRSTGPHLHYEVHKNGQKVNPINYYFNDITAEQYDEMVARCSEEGGKTMD